ncbi:RING-H2 finger protein ATL13-like [Durio zibethinus]|uniref:RING-type E3 ubiquitin transferase n=1 Tax=Durio zibethinus TaxID=66656 RepID=A0A6P5XSL8_DURZI|nr:RING-H2 finger protein ATL13-like [Durio zibethinus]
MDWIFHEIKQRNLLSPSEQPYYLPQSPPLLPPPQNLQSDSLNLDNKVSPSILLIIIILAIVFFVSGLLHLLVRFLLRPPNREPEDIDNVTALQGQLQQLFHLHDAGVDQSFIDTLPVFHYKAIIGVKNPFDCAVCLCEFEPEDKLRLLPKCSHAFHMECIDTWLLSHSTCPLCRGSLLPDFSPNNGCSPIVLVLESGSESSREIVTDRESILGRTSSVLRSNSHLGHSADNELGSSQRKSSEIPEKDEVNPTVVVDSGEKVVSVRLGKFRNVDGGESSSNNNVDARRCFSMGSFEYVMDENSFLQVPIRTPMKKPSSKKTSLPLTAGHRLAMSECDCESRRGFNGFQSMRNFETNGSSGTNENNGKAIGKSKKESFSISKIWLREKRANQNFTEDSSRRAFSFRFPVHQNVSTTTAADDVFKVKNGIGGARDTISEIDSGRWANGGSEFGCDEENQSCYSLDSQAKTPSFARRTLLWLAGRQNKVVHSSFTPKV